jgi:hypothetical protein
MVTLVDHHDEPYIQLLSSEGGVTSDVANTAYLYPNFDIKAASTSINHLDLLDAETLKFAAPAAW